MTNLFDYQVFVDDEDPELDNCTMKIRERPNEIYVNTYVWNKIREAYLCK